MLSYTLTQDSLIHSFGVAKRIFFIYVSQIKQVVQMFTLYGTKQGELMFTGLDFMKARRSGRPVFHPVDVPNKWEARRHLGMSPTVLTNTSYKFNFTTHNHDFCTFFLFCLEHVFFCFFLSPFPPLLLPIHTLSEEMARTLESTERGSAETTQ